MEVPVESHPMLDHIVILVSPSVLNNLDDHNISMLCEIWPGGEHANGITYNKLILFRDGFYIELIAFKEGTSPEARAAHHWGKCKENKIIDWAFTLGHVDILREVQSRIAEQNTGFQYQQPWRMGRKREDDGMELKWFMSLCEHQDGSREEKVVPPGLLPFFCLDDTPRWFRVPYLGNMATMHGASSDGLSRVKVFVPEDQGFENVEKVYKAMLGDELKFLTPSLSSKIVERHRIELVKIPAGEPNRIEMILASNSADDEIDMLPGLSFKYERSLRHEQKD